MKGNELRAIRNRLGLTQAKLANAVNVATNTVARWERAELRIPDRIPPILSDIADSTGSGSTVINATGVVLDPFHQKIVEALQGKLDPDAFEVCATDLIREDGWSVVHVPGGSDDGFDGTVADGANAPFPLAVTTGDDALRNLRKSLRTARRQGWGGNSAIFATSRQLNGRMRRNLRDAAEEFGFRLVQSYDRGWFARQLYRDPAWCKRLLGITGRPRALSIFPKTQRPNLSDDVFGREREMQWLLSRKRDCLLVGSPGSGKTHLLRSLAVQGQALFLVDDDLENIAADFRELNPTAVIIDDAHVEPHVVQKFAQFRREVNAEDVPMILTCWPSEAPAIRNMCHIAEAEVFELGLLGADTIIEIIKNIGLDGPDQLLAVIRQQAAGLPGLAATLAHLCLVGNVRGVVVGDAIVSQLAPALDTLLGRDAKRLLAPFALGGDAGVDQTEVANYLGIPLFEISSQLARLAAAGVVQEKPNRAVSVVPAAMRAVLVRDVFFGGAGSIDPAPALEIVANRHDGISTLIEAQARGANVPNLVALIENTSSSRLWSRYAWLGPSQTEYVLNKHPELASNIAEPGLAHVPEMILPKLLNEVRGTDYEFRFLYRGPIDAIKQWIDHVPSDVDIGEVIHRKATLATATVRWWRSTRKDRVAIHMLCIALNPDIDYSYLDPGAAKTIKVVFGVLPHQTIEQLIDIWPVFMEVIEAAEEVPWKDVLDLVGDWHFWNPEINLPQQTRIAMRDFATRMLKDLSNATRTRPGVQHLLHRRAVLSDTCIYPVLDPDFEAVYPKHRRFTVEEHDQAIDLLVERLGRLETCEMAALLVSIDSEARYAGILNPSLVLSSACARLAERRNNSLIVCESLIRHKVAGDLIEPFLLQAANLNVPGWVSLVTQCLDDPAYERLAVSVILRHSDPESEMLSVAIQKASNMLELLETYCLRGQVPDATLRALFGASNPKVASAAAVGHWHSCTPDNVDENLLQPWQDAIMRCARESSNFSRHDVFSLDDILLSDSDLAKDWLIAALCRESLSFDVESLAARIVPNMNFDQRREVLKALPVEADWTTRAIVRTLIAEDFELYRELLECEDLAAYHISPLEAKPDPAWLARAILAETQVFRSIAY